jgi:hypothetical protein
VFRALAILPDIWAPKTLYVCNQVPSVLIIQHVFEGSHPRIPGRALHDHPDKLIIRVVPSMTGVVHGRSNKTKFVPCIDVSWILTHTVNTMTGNAILKIKLLTAFNRIGRFELKVTYYENNKEHNNGDWLIIS